MCLSGISVGGGGSLVGLQAVPLRLQCGQQGVFDVHGGRGLTCAKAIDTLGKALGAIVNLAHPLLGTLTKTARLGHAQE
jgi:hypothetical protein